MPELDAIPQKTSPEAVAVESAEIAVALPTYNNEESIAEVAQSVEAGLVKYFPSRKYALIHCDGGSQDNTAHCVREAIRDQRHLLQVQYSPPQIPGSANGLPVQGSALRCIFQQAQKLGAKVCLVVDSESSSIQPEWIDLFVRPVLEKDFDFVTSYYDRHKYEATLTKGIVYPMVRALYGKRIFQPMGGDCAFSQRPMEHYLKQDIGHSKLAGSRVDLWITIQTLCNNLRVGQAFVGPLRRSPNEPARDISSLLAEVLGALFLQMEKTVGYWQKVRVSEVVPHFGSRAQLDAEPVAVNVKRMTDAYRLGYQTLQEIWGLVLPPATLLDLKKLASRPDEQFRIADEAWARVIYDFALGYRLRMIGRDHLLRALTPLYLGWCASFILEMEKAGPREVEARLEKLCLAYEAQKPYFISRWRWPDRFNP
ncbi:MAG: glycosyl transferase family 2 [Acidobacteria bacterium]|nr:glycosyl transferase family 2 [Acidobacteriota bacterium]